MRGSCRLYYPGQYLRFGTLVRYHLFRVLEACECLKILSGYFDLLVDAAGVACHQLGLLGTAVYAVSCGGFVETPN